MAIVKITELPVASTPLSNAELTAIVQNNVTKQVALQNILSVNVTSFTGTGSQTQFVLPTAINGASANVYVNGVYQRKATYSVANNVLSFSQAPPITSYIEVMHA